MAYFDAEFHLDAQGELLLVSCANDGRVYAWNVPAIEADSQESMDSGFDTVQSSARPRYRWDLSAGVLYKLGFHLEASKTTLLVVAGEEGVLLYAWNQLVKGILDRRGHLRTHPASPYRRFSEVNDFVIVDHQLYAAVGDAFGCYKWDLNTQQLLATYPVEGGVLTMAVASNSTILLGGSNGVLSVWDCVNDKLIDEVPLNTKSPQPDSRSKHSPKKWISSIAVIDDNWWTVAGGRDRGGDGFLVSIYAPTKSIVANVSTRETPKKLALLNRVVLSAANERAVSHWYPTSMERIRQVSTVSLAAYAVAISPDNRVAVGGVGGSIDLFDQQGTEQTFRFNTN